MPIGPKCSAPCSGTRWPWRAVSPRPIHMSPSAPPPAGTGRISPGENGGSSVLECARPAWLAGIGSAATRRSRGTRGEPWGGCTGTGTWGRLGLVALALAQHAASLQKPARSQDRCWGDPNGSTPPPPPPSIACSLQPSPSAQGGLPPIPTCLCCFSSFFSFSFSSFSLWQSSLEARS